jgi:general secretion pathway protein H
MGPLASSTSRTGYAPWRSRAAGFTLAEILVVLVVIGLAAGLTYARFDNDPRQTVEREGRRLAAAIEHAAALAQWRNQTLGVSSGGASYGFWRREHAADGDRWVPLTDDDVLVARSLPDGVTAAATQYAGQNVPPDAILPLAASGRNEPYAMEIASLEWHAFLVADPLNRVTLTAPSVR